MMHVGRLILTVALLLGSAAGARATTVIQPTFENLVGGAEYVVRARVKSVNSRWRQNPAQPAERYIGSSIELEVLEVIKGTPPQPLVLEVVGGRVGDQEMHVEGAPRLEVGSESILFIRRNGETFFPLVALMHGYFPVVRDAKTGAARVLRHDGQPLRSERELEPGNTLRFSGGGLSPESFRDRIQQQEREILSRENLR